jgi:hypothetical protein
MQYQKQQQVTRKVLDGFRAGMRTHHERMRTR